MTLQYNCNWFRIGLSEAAMYKNYFKFYGIPAPNTAPYKTFSGTFSQSQGGLVQHGYSKVTLTWNELMPKQAFIIKQFVEGALGAVPGGTGLLYLTILKNNADNISRNYIDVVGVPHPLDVTEGGEIVGSLGAYYQNIVLVVNNLSIVNDPAIF